MRTWKLGENCNNLYKLFHGNKKMQNIDISGWDVSNVTNMTYMFGSSNFNGDISKWDTSNVTNMSYMFEHTPFNQNINTKVVSRANGTTYIAWDVSNVTTMHYMFAYAKQFNQDISKWDTSNVTAMYYMFLAANAFDQNINTKTVILNDGTSYCAWNVNNANMTQMWLGSQMPAANKPGITVCATPT
jgi:surface protein